MRSARRAGVGARGLSRTVAAVAAAVAVVGLQGTVAAGQDGGDVVRCLDSRLRPSDDCPTLNLDLKATVEGDLLVIEVTNAGDQPWEGEPVAVEGVTSGPVETPSGEVEVDAELGQAGWTTRAGAVVARCVFAPAGEIAPGSSVKCALPRLDRPDGPWPLWLTGFTGGTPDLSPVLGDVPPAVGVVSVATSRSFEVQLDGSTATVVQNVDGDEGGGSASGSQPEGQGSDGGIPDAVVGAGGLVVTAVAVGGWQLWRRRRSGGGRPNG